MLVVGQHLPIGTDECNTKSGSGSLLLNPTLQDRSCRILRQEFRKNHRSGFETAFLVVYIIGVNPVGHKTIDNHQEGRQQQNIRPHNPQKKPAF